MRKLALAGLALASLGAAPVAQRTIHVVDAELGPGATFADIQPAVDAAQDGDAIVVRPGMYSAFAVVGKALSILGEPGADVVASGATAVAVRQVPAGRDTALYGLSVTGSFPTSSPDVMQVSDCAGRVLMEEVSMQDTAGATVLRVERSRQVMLEDCTFAGRVRLEDSQATIQDSVCDGGFGFVPAVGLQLLGSSAATVSRCTITGGRGLFVGYPDAAAIWANGTGTSLTVTGDGTGALRASTGSAIGASAIRGDGTLLLDPDVPLSSSAGQPLLDPALTVQSAEIPSLSMRGAPLGGVVDADLNSTPGDLYVLYAAASGDAFAFPAFGGSIWLDLHTVAQAGLGVLDATGRGRLAVPFGSSTALIGWRVTWQALAGPDLSSLRLSNASGYVHRP
ncbi:MAG: hypothetical protein AAF628_03150 [Planctomycetota bacterium]